MPTKAADRVIDAAGPNARAAWEAFAHDPTLGPRTRAQYASIARGLLRWLDRRGLALVEVSRDQLDEYFADLTARPASRGQYRVPLRKLFKTLHTHGVVPTNPLERPLRRPPRKLEDYLTSTEVSEQTRQDPGRSRPPSRARLKEMVRELALDPVEEGTEEFDAAMVLLAGAHFGTRRVLPLSRLTGVAPRRVAEFAGMLRENGVWTPDGKTACEWLDEHGTLAFWMDVWIAQGLVARVSVTEPESAIPLPDRRAER